MAHGALHHGRPGVRAWQVLATALSLFVLVALLAAGSAQAAFRGANGKIAFDYAVADEGDGNPPTSSEIWTQTPGLDDRRRLTTNDARDTDPTWSANGKEIAFVSDRTGSPQIWVMREDGSNQRQITHAAAGATSPTWSPSGLFIAYASAGDIWATTIFGVFSYRVTRTGDVLESTPAWSPNGQRIAYTAQATGGPSQIWSARFDGRQAVDLSAVAGDAAYSDSEPDWAPDGSGLIYASTRGEQSESSVTNWRMNANGTNPTQITLSQFENDTQGTVYSPDGHAIAQASGIGEGTGSIFIGAIGADGMVDAQIGSLGPISQHGFLLNPSWQPLR